MEFIQASPSPAFRLFLNAYLVGPQIIIFLFARHKLHAAIALFLLYSFSGIIIGGESWVSPYPIHANAAWILTTVFLPVFLLSVAPAKAVSRRLIFLALGLFLLIGLNELSKLGLDVTAPKVQG
jgi:hypothetical protein